MANSGLGKRDENRGKIQPQLPSIILSIGRRRSNFGMGAVREKKEKSLTGAKLKFLFSRSEPWL